MGLPEPPQLAEFGRAFYEQYGVIVLVCAAAIEGTFFLGYYLPGSFVILLAVFVAPRNFESLFLIWIYCAVGFILGFILSYAIGRYGAYEILQIAGQGKKIAGMRKRLSTTGTRAVIVSSLVPNMLLPICAVCLGIARHSLRRLMPLVTLSIAASVAVWTLLAATFLKNVNIENPNQHYFIAAGFVVWGIFRIAKSSMSDTAKL